MREQAADERDWDPDVRVAAQTAPRPRVVGRTIPCFPRPPAQVLPESSVSYRCAKRGLDLVVATLVLVLAAPVLILAAIAIRFESTGPALFRQWRVGQNGVPFRILKFRTLTVQEDGDDVVQVRRHDSRLTRLGPALRRVSFDELPQLINVIRGDMSLVGPRPHALAHDRTFSRQIDNYASRHSVKPGLTGWAQIHGLRGETTIEEMRTRVRFDVWYAGHASFLLDLRILLATPRAVLGGTKAW